MPFHNLSSRCTALKSNGDFCDAPSAEDMPFPICALHATRVYTRVAQMATGALCDPSTGLLRALMTPPPPERSKRCHDPVVYYVQIGEHIKIGITTNLKLRLNAYPPNRRLLATEPGNLSKEHFRHRQFNAHLAMGNEWFHPAQALVDHINELRRQAGSSPIKQLATGPPATAGTTE